MKDFNLIEIACAVGGRLDHAMGRELVKGVFTDTRKPINKGIFFCLEGTNFDGHDFAKQAEELGAGAIVARKKIDVEIPVIYVTDTVKALNDLASYYRGFFDIPLVGVTGSVGKTTTKDMTSLVLATKFNTIKTQGNLNNSIGMPMTLFSIDESTEAAVIEMGMNHFGEISFLSKVARPTAAIITKIGTSHIENLGSRENIMKAKLEILDGASKDAPLILNRDDDLLSKYVSQKRRVIFFGINDRFSEVRALKVKLGDKSSDFQIEYRSKRYNVHLPVAGMHNVYDALAAFSAGIALGVDLEAAANAFTGYKPTGMRQQIEEIAGITLIEDCYNASPDSVEANLVTLSNMKATRRIAVLGDMLELGDTSEQSHYRCGQSCVKNNVNILFTYGVKSQATVRGAKDAGLRFAYNSDSETDLARSLATMLLPGDVVLFKASRAMKLENVISDLKEKLKKKYKVSE